MIKGNIPNNKKDAEIFLSAKKIQLLELAAKISNGDLETSAQILGFVWNEVEQLDKMIDSGDYSE